MIKTCTKCLQDKDIELFSKDKTKLDGRYTMCKTCHCARSKEWREKNPNYNTKYSKDYRLTKSEKLKDTKMRKRYGVSMIEFKEMMIKQKGVCAICKGTNSDRELAVDHCHTTGKVRGLLCSNCNNGIGRFKDDIKLLATAIKYLK